MVSRQIAISSECISAPIVASAFVVAIEADLAGRPHGLAAKQSAAQ
jgi:hypothetical protein